MKKILIVIILLFASATVFHAQSACKRHVEKAGGFSYCPPANWIKDKNNPDSSYNGFIVPPGEKFYGTSVSVRSADMAMPLTKFVDQLSTLTLETLPEEDNSIKSIKIESRAEFSTTSGLKGEKVIYWIDSSGAILNSINFFFAGEKDKKIVMTFSIAESERSEISKLIDDTAKSFQLEK